MSFLPWLDPFWSASFSGIRVFLSCYMRTQMTIKPRETILEVNKVRTRKGYLFDIQGGNKSDICKSLPIPPSLQKKSFI